MEGATGVKRSQYPSCRFDRRSDTIRFEELVSTVEGVTPLRSTVRVTTAGGDTTRPPDRALTASRAEGVIPPPSITHMVAVGGDTTRPPHSVPTTSNAQGVIPPPPIAHVVTVGGDTSRP
jgi:hypothetical protein